MTSHELAKKLLEGPDLRILKHTSDGVFEIQPPEVETVEKWREYRSINICYWPELTVEDGKERFQVITV